MSTTLWQALLSLSQTSVEAGWLGIAFALGAVATFLGGTRWRAAGRAGAVLVEDDELAFVEEVVARASTPPEVARSSPSVPPPLPSRAVPSLAPTFVGFSRPEVTASAEADSPFLDLKLSELLDQFEAEAAAPASPCAEDADEFQTRAWSRSELLRSIGSIAAESQPTPPESALRLPHRPGASAPVRGVDVAAVRRRLQQHGGRA